MDHNLIRAALIIIAIVAFYAVIARGLFKITEPHRWDALELAEKLNHSAQVSDRIKITVQQRLTEVYSNWRAWQLVGLVICVAVMAPFKSIRTHSKPLADIPAHLERDYDLFSKKWMIATLANSPLATLLFVTVTLLIVAFSISMSALFNALAFQRDHHDGAKAI